MLQIFLSSLGAYLGSKWIINNMDNPYLNYIPHNKWDSEWLYIFIRLTGTWVLIFTNFVPISLLVTLELVKFWQAGFMQKDILMYDVKQDMPMSVQSSSINEELGQVKYIFSDKTGTLTCNVMEFKNFSTITRTYEADDRPGSRT